MFEPEKDRGTREGAVRGLSSLGDQGIRKGLIESRGAKTLGKEYGEADQGIVGAVLVSPILSLAVSVVSGVNELHTGTTRSPREAQ